MQFRMSSYVGSQYLSFEMPSPYALANCDSVCIARIADENCVIGCIPFGNARIIPSTCAGNFARSWRSAVSDAA